MLEEDGIKIAIPLESIESYQVYSFSAPMFKVCIHTFGGELDDVSFALPLYPCTPDQANKLELLEKYRTIRRAAAKERASKGEEREQPPIVLQLGSSLNWIMPSVSSEEDGSAVSMEKPTPEVILKAVFAIPAHEQLWGKLEQPVPTEIY
jgi:hypothetical protein